MRNNQEEEEERYDFDFDNENFEEGISKTKTCLEYEESLLSWEEQAFAEDAGRLGACVWPPTSYSCSFCRREFRSAQALGGHMNVHRRDRAKLKQSPIHNNNNHPNFPFQSPSSSSRHLSSTLPNPNPLSGATYSSCGRPSGLKVGKADEEFRSSNYSCSRVRVDDKHHVGIGVLDEGLNYGFDQSRLMSGLFYDEDEGVIGCKRRKMNDEVSSPIQFCMKSSSMVENHRRRHIQSEVIGLSSSSLHELDLELRLGGLSKG